MAKTSCSSPVVILKETVLAMLQAHSVTGFKVGETVQYIKKGGITSFYTVLEILGPNLKIGNTVEILTVPSSNVQSTTPDIFLDKLKNNEWSITSFDPATRVVCINLQNGVTTINLSVTLPIVKTNNNNL